MVNRWVTAALILTVLSLLGSAIVISQVAQSTGGGSGESNATCPNGQFATSESSNGAFFCGAQNAVSTEAAAGCPANQFATTESANGGLGCATALTTQTAVSTEQAGGCSALNLYATTESANGNMNCAQVMQGFNYTGIQLYAQLDEGTGVTPYDWSINNLPSGTINGAFSWVNRASCFFQQNCVNLTQSNAQYIKFPRTANMYNDSGTFSVTMCEWFKPLVANSGTDTVFGDLSQLNVYGYTLLYSTGLFTAQRFNNTASTTITASGTTGDWQFPCISYKANTFSLYVNGTLKSSASSSFAINYAKLNLNQGIVMGGDSENPPNAATRITGYFSTFYETNYALNNNTALALFEYVPHPTEQLLLQWQQLRAFPAGCAGNQFVNGVTTTLSCSSAWFSYGSCPANQFATAITTTTLNCGAVSTEAIASCSTGQFATTESAAGGFGCGNPNIQFVTNSSTCTDTTSGSAVMAGMQVNYTPNGTGKVSVTLNFKIATPATVSLNSQWQLAFGTGKEPVCNAAATGTLVGQKYEQGTWAAIASFVSPSVTAGVFTLTPGTRYWFDLQITDSSAAAWTYSLPQLTIVES